MPATYGRGITSLFRRGVLLNIGRTLWFGRAIQPRSRLSFVFAPEKAFRLFLMALVLASVVAFYPTRGLLFLT